MADFRSVTAVDRDRLVGALGNKITVQESPWLNLLLITFNTRKKPFDDARVRWPCRWPSTAGKPPRCCRDLPSCVTSAATCGRASNWPRATLS